MIRSRRCLAVPSLGAHHEVVAWIEQTARVHVMRTSALTCDDRLYQLAFGRADAGDRSVVSLVLRGRLYLESGAFSVRCDPGEGVYLPTKGALAVRTEGAEYESLVLEWDAEEREPPRPLAFDVAELAPLAEALVHASAPDLPTLDRILAALTEIGPTSSLRFESTSTVGPKELRAQEIADALDAVLSSLEAQPMATDLETRLGVSSRQVTRMVDAFRARYGYGAVSWLDARNRRRLLLAATLLTADGATVAEVARIVGYQRPETLARAFATAGLPKPSQVREHVVELGALWREGTLTW